MTGSSYPERAFVPGVGLPAQKRPMPGGSCAPTWDVSAASCYAFARVWREERRAERRGGGAVSYTHLRAHETEADL
eukprot:2771322-Rhodomonas_salina.1